MSSSPVNLTSVESEQECYRCRVPLNSPMCKLCASEPSLTKKQVGQLRDTGAVYPAQHREHSTQYVPLSRNSGHHHTPWRRGRIPSNPYRSWANQTLKNHERTGCEIAITVEELTELAAKTPNCMFCRTELGWGTRQGMRSNSPTLDRLHNGHMISKDTILILCMRCNRTKGDRPMAEFIKFCQLIGRKFGGTQEK